MEQRTKGCALRQARFLGGTVHFFCLVLFVVGVTAVTQPAFAVRVTEDFETGDFSRLPWQRATTPGGAPQWYVTTDPAADEGTYGARSGAIADSQMTEMSISVTFGTGGGTVRIRAKEEVTSLREIGTQVAASLAGDLFPATTLDRIREELDRFRTEREGQGALQR